MPKRRDDVVRVLLSDEKFGFREADGGGHDTYELKLENRQLGWTMVSRGAKARELDDDTLAKIAKQLKLTPKAFKTYFACKLNWIDYARHLRTIQPEHARLVPDVLPDDR